MKKLLLAIAVASALSAVVPAHASCSGHGVRIGEYDTGSVTVDGITIHAERFGELVAGPAQVCDDGSAGPAPITGSLTISDATGQVLCHTNDVMGVDPFGFGTGVHFGGPTHDAACGADVTWVDLAPTFGADQADVGLDPNGAHVGVRKNPGELDPATTAVPSACTPDVPGVPTPPDPIPDPGPAPDPTCVGGTSTGGTSGMYWLERGEDVAIPAGTVGYLTRGLKVEIDGI